MKTRIRFSRGGIGSSIRIARASFAAWADSPEGRSALAPVASHLRFALFGRMRAARRRVWRSLVRAVRIDTLVAALQREIDRFLQLDDLACAELPRVAVDLRRLVVVPRVFVNSDAYTHIYAALRAQPAFAAAEGGDPLRAWFARAVIAGVEAAVVRTRPSPDRPLPAGNNWTAVGVNERFEWQVPIAGPVWRGHYYALELRPVPVTRAVRKATRDSIMRLEASLSALSLADRTEIVRQARLSLEGLSKSPRLR